MSNPSMLDVLEQLRRSPNESATVEFKSNLSDPKAIGEYISALANSAALEGHTRAWLVWGVEDGTHALKGTTFDPFSAKGEGNQSLIMWLQQLTSPRADFSFHAVSHPDGKVILLEIHPARSTPIAVQGTRFIRVDSHKVKLADHADKEARLWEALGVKQDWTGEIVASATLDDLDPDAIDFARARFIEYQRIGDGEYYAQELFQEKELRGYIDNMLMNTEKAVYEHVVYDSDVERNFASELERNEAIKVYAKLPGWFKIPTPLDNYNPDWAVLLVGNDGQERLYFVVETKGSLFSDALRPIEEGKIKCGKAHFLSLAVGESRAEYVVERSVEGLLSRL